MTDVALRLALRGSNGRVLEPRPLTGPPATVTVVLPCYRYGHYLDQAVASANDQPGLEVDVIIVDDCSPDDSGEVAEQLAAEHDRVRVIRHETNRGHLTTYNDGLAAATGEFVALVSADDLLTPGSLSRAVALMRAEPSVGFAYGRARHFSGEPPAPELELRSWVTWKGNDWLRSRFAAGHNVIASPEVVLRRSVLESVGPFRSDLPHSGDLELWMRAAAYADVGYVVGPDQALYRQHESNMHTSMFGVGDPSAVIVDIEHRWEAFRAIVDPPVPGLADPAGLEALARRALAAEAWDGAAAARRRGIDADVVADLERLGRTLDAGYRPPGSAAGVFARRVANRARGSYRWWRINQAGA